MKDDKICFSKTLTYLVLLVAVVFGAFWVMNVANTQKLGANPKAAAGDCIIRVSGVSHIIANGSCVKDSVPYYANNSYICKDGNPWGKVDTCAPGAATAPTCVAGKITAKSGADGCYYQRGPGKISNGRCIVDSTSGAACAPAVGSNLAAVTTTTNCNVPYGGELFELAVGDCLKGQTAVNGVLPPINSIRCKSPGSFGKDPYCAPKCSEYRACPGGTAFRAVDSSTGGECLCFNNNSTTEFPSLQ